MKRRVGSFVLAVALVTSCCLSASCRKNRSEKEETKPSEETPTSSNLQSEQTGSDHPESYITENTTVDLHLTDYQIELGRPPYPADPDGTIHQRMNTMSLGSGNTCNEGFATGNDDFMVFVVHPERYLSAIQLEYNASGEAFLIYTLRPQKGAPNSIDSLILAKQYLFFRENESSIMRMDLRDFSVEQIAEGEITRLNIYEDYLFFCDDSSIVRCDLDGKNKEVLYTAQSPVKPADIALCVCDGTVFFADPENIEENGYLSGKIYAMDIDGQNRREILEDAVAYNFDVFFSDGEKLYFYGVMQDTPDMVKLSNPDTTVVGKSVVTVIGSQDDEEEYGKDLTGFFCARPDGSDVTFIQTYPGGSVNVVDGKIYWSVADYIFETEETSLSYDNILDSKFVIVGGWIYYREAEPEYPEDATIERSMFDDTQIVVLEQPRPHEERHTDP